MATNAKERKKLEKEANGKSWGVLPPEPGHPQPGLAWRLYNNIPGMGWTHIMFGHEKTMKGIAAECNRSDELFAQREKLLKQNMRLIKGD